MAGSIFNMSDNAVNLNGLHSYAQKDIRTKRVSQLYKRSLVFSLLAARGGNGEELGRPGAYVIVGGDGKISEATQRKLAGSSEVQVRLQNQLSGGFKFMGERDTTPAVDISQDQNTGSASFRWCKCAQPIKVWNSTLETSGGDKYKIADAVEEANQEAMQTMITNLSAFFYLGSPTDQTKNIWDQPLGLVPMCHTTNKYGNVDRNTAPGSTAWIGKRVTTSQSAGLELINDANVTQGIQDTSPSGVDTVLCGKANYLKFKREAQARQQYQVVSDMPDFAKIGFKFEAFFYGNCIIAYDPFIKDYSLAANQISGLAQTDITNYVFMMTMKDIMMDIHSANNFRVTRPIDQGEMNPGGDDAQAWQLRLMFRLWNPTAWSSCLYTSVS